MTTTVHICAPRPDSAKLGRFDCPDCRVGYRYGRKQVPPRKRKPFGIFAHTPWYGLDVTCLACGLRGQDGEIIPAPFAPRWRQESVERARKFYRGWKEQRP